jgi:hypothetical protein
VQRAEHRTATRFTRVNGLAYIRARILPVELILCHPGDSSRVHEAPVSFVSYIQPILIRPSGDFFDPPLITKMAHTAIRQNADNGHDVAHNHRHRTTSVHWRLICAEGLRTNDVADLLQN